MDKPMLTDNKIVSSDDAVLYSIFPEELWLKILHKTSTTTRRQNFYSHPFFRRILTPTRQYFLFPAIWKILVPKLERDLLPSYINEDFMFEGPERIFPTAEIVQSGRLVCKDWGDGIDYFYENSDNWLEFDGYRNQARNENWFPFNYYFQLCNLEKLEQQYLHDYSATPNKNPFIGRVFKLRFSFLELEFVELLERVLQMFGHHIWYFELRADITEPVTITNYVRVQSWLRFTPNLKSFKWTIGHDRLFEGHADVSSAEIDQLAVDIETFPLQKLSHLQFLCLDVPVVIANHFINVNNHLKFIDCDVPVNWSTLHLPELTKLRLKHIKLEDISEFELAQGFGSCLQVLHVNLSENLSFISWDRILNLLEIWKDTLVDVDLGLPANQSREEAYSSLVESGSTRMNLPKLKKLKTTLPNLVSIDFILPLKDSLEELHCVCLKAHETTLVTEADKVEMLETQIVPFQWDAVNLAHIFGCDLWNMFPNLKHAKVTIVPYSSWLSEHSRTFFRPV